VAGTVLCLHVQMRICTAPFVGSVSALHQRSAVRRLTCSWEIATGRYGLSAVEGAVEICGGELLWVAKV
jgi:hypothetical protein